MKRNSRRTLFVAAAVVLIAGAVLWRRVRPHPHPSPSPAASAPADSPAASPPAPAPPSTSPAPSGDAPVESAAAMVLRIEDAHARLLALAARNASPGERAAAALALRHELRAASQKSSAEAIAMFLESGRDASTGMPFAPAPGGFLDAAPTLRTLLLDELERLDPARAREAAEAVFASATPVADEWSLALRITAHTDAATPSPVTPAFVDRVQTLLGNPAWLREPSVGFLHGFDAAVYSNHAAIVDRLATLAAAPQADAVRFAARLALDRMTIADYATAAGRLVNEPALLADDPAYRGQLLARADVSQPAARDVLERFLTTPETPTADLKAWAEFFPHRGKHLSNNLLTSDTPTPISELARMDRAALTVVREWRADPAMASVQPWLATVQTRLEQYVASADRGEAARAAATRP